MTFTNILQAATTQVPDASQYRNTPCTGMHKLTNVVRSYGFRARMFDVPCPVARSRSGTLACF